ncbi:WD repeat domain phosphoinositide-interacting protein 2 isoform X2 [Schistocerca americana]|uniref:WD repeat domain phosphoinositide-interacting protein 2 isoform X2 n=2 Tax=Schistocerca TaxID=7008 RepID=UPI001F4F921A|nr:WD repeat domain phosphoinositide-interacting protein 2 isoform X2 [Schistocerca americana]XP_049775623.1 WD repeat domain phosphoinositide-interacting protein 2 isoform X2 [Schistocerca cancellata]XP_049800598.1 WD repeat domain phosphoinositide-interacting protein 2 isoform X2 [Schistocerca nitens]XP_049951509.1 WD repeat domain phosphoinositide-interacting protein 2 isoform X2 [Schistocerca serialis cubense]
MQNFAKNVDVLTQGLKAGISGLMNLASQGSDPNSGVFFVNFNQDCTSLAVGTKTGYRLFSLNSVDHLEQIYENDAEDICIVERLFSSSLVAVVSLSSPRKLKVCHFKKGTEICNYSYSNTILAVKLNRSRLVVCLEESLYIHNIRDMKVLHTIRDTPPNPSGLCTLSVNSDCCYLAYPGSNTIGEVQIFDTINLHAKTMIPAHDSPLAALAFSTSGTKVATASEKGTVIRVFLVNDGTKLYEFRRGVKRCVSISSLAFSIDSNFLCCSSNTETVHVFKLEEPREELRRVPSENQGWMGYLSKAVSASANYLPSQVTTVFSQGRAFATVHLPFQGLRNVCAITVIQKVLRLLVASADGYLYVYNLDPNEGGDCTLLKQHRLDGKLEQPAEQAAGATCISPENAHSASKPVTNASAPPGAISSYAGILKGCSPGSMSGTVESEKFHEMAAATESPPKGGFRFDDESEFPPVTQKTE